MSKRTVPAIPEDDIRTVRMIRLTKDEAEDLRRSRSQSVTLTCGQYITHFPPPVTEHSAIMAATVLGGAFVWPRRTIVWYRHTK